MGKSTKDSFREEKAVLKERRVGRVSSTVNGEVTEPVATQFFDHLSVAPLLEMKAIETGAKVR